MSTNVEDLFVPYEESLALKGLGFDEPCFAYYDEEDSEKQVYEYANCSHNVTSNRSCYNDDFLSVTNTQLDNYGAFGAKDEEGEESFSRWTAPLYQQAFRWFRDEHNLRYKFEPSRENTVDIFIWADIGWEYFKNANEEQAELVCLRKLIQILKS